jgi:hypothetical protein
VIADGAMNKVEGRDAYLGRLKAMDLPGASFSVELTQSPVVVDGEQVLVMVEVRAERGPRSLHNFAAHLLRVSGGRISERRMVDAKPAASDRLWS